MKILVTSLTIFLCSPTLAEELSTQGAELRKQDEIRILVMGDSLSAAYYIPLESGWVSLLQNRIAAAGLPVKIINSSISGATTAAGLQTLPVVLQNEKPHIVVLELGGNDGLQGKPISLITQSLEKLIQQARDAGATILLIGMQLPPNLGSRYTEPFFQQYAVLAEKYHLAYVPFLLDGIAGNAELMQEDGIHPTAEAQPRILENVWPTLKKLLKEKLS